MNTGPDDSAASASLPPVLSNYLAASDRDDIDAIVACFANDAVVLDEDRQRTRKDHGPDNLALLRRFALNVLRQDKSKGSLTGKMKRAGWDDAFLLSLLAQMR